MASQINDNYCDWFDAHPCRKTAIKFINRLLHEEFVDMEDLPLATEVMCDSDVQRFDVTSIECVPLDMIAERPVWVQKRLDRIREWSDIETINSLPINKNNSNRFDEVASHSLPYLTRDVSLDKNCNIIFDKYDIADGIHRVARARELGASCILSRATNIVKIKR